MAYMVNCAKVIVGEIESGLPQRAIGQSYARAIISAANGIDVPDWSIINKAILDRWSMSGLERIKKMAHKAALNW